MNVRKKLINCVNKAMVEGQSSLMNNDEDITFEIRPCVPDRIVIIRKEDGCELYSERHKTYNSNIDMLLNFINDSARAI